MAIMSKMRSGRRVKGFTLIEISMVLLIIGIIIGGALKGRDLIEAAQLRSVACDFQTLRVAYANYINSYGKKPGGTDANKVFDDLHSAGLIANKDFKVPRIGGQYKIVDGPKVQLADNGRGSLTERQANTLQTKVNELVGEEGGFEKSEDSSKYRITIRLD